MFKYFFMSTEFLNNDNKINKVNVNYLKSRIILQEKKKRLQSKIIYLSVIASIGVIGYFLT